MEYSVDNTMDMALQTAIEENSITPLVKMELASKVRQRRLLSGKGDIEVSFQPPITYELTPEEKRKIELRKQRNRWSAEKARSKRKAQEENLKRELKKYEDEQRELRDEIQKLKTLETQYMKILYSHKVLGRKIVSSCRLMKQEET